MRGPVVAVVVVLVVGLLIFGSFSGTYNHLVQASQQVNAAQADV
ncbi:MAG: LemA family protein, partial [Bacillati bacterium ANGP1]